ncbi:MAG: phosphate ABC transporter substrate-binding protein PstS [Actinomycetota bacterium]|nr:phosphate ABC transporter substrate-binding protein PstS [Actinomycetota bacterium]
MTAPREATHVIKTPLHRRTAAPLAAAVALGLGLSACSASNEESSGGSSESGSSSSSELSGTLSGAGSSAQEAAMAGWRKGFQEMHPDVTVNYDPVGSGGGREQFIAGESLGFAGSDAFLEGDELKKAQKRCGGDVVEIPAYVSPIAVIFNLPDVSELNLKPETIAGIFAGEITNWNDEAIAADNPDADLPDLDINPVHRSDESGTTDNFTSYLGATAPDIWTVGNIEVWPGKLGGEGADGTSGVVQSVQSGEGSIGYADASQAGDLGTASVGVGEEFVSYTPEAAAKVLEASSQTEGRGETDLAYDLARDTTESGVYPIVLVSYQIACPEYSDPKQAELTKAFLEFAISKEGQAASADSAGSAPIPSSVAEKAQTALDAIKTS